MTKFIPDVILNLLNDNKAWVVVLVAILNYAVSQGWISGEFLAELRSFLLVLLGAYGIESVATASIWAHNLSKKQE